MNILFTCAGRRKYLIDYFKKELPNFGGGVVVGADMSTMAPALSSCDKLYEVKSVYSDKYIDTLLKICKKEDINALISLSDLELPILARNKHKFSSLGVKLIVSDNNVIDICSDKWKTIEFALENNIPVPKTYLYVKDAMSDIKSGNVSYPLIVKPRWGSASFGLKVVRSDEGLISFFDKCGKDIAKSHIANFGEQNENVIVQEYIVGKEYGLDIFNDLNSKYRGVICKEKLSMRSGETEKSLSVCSLKFEEYANNIATNLRHIGNLDCDFLENENGLFLLELNPRFGGGYPFSHESGGNLVRALLLSISDNHDSIEIKYEKGNVFAKCDEIVNVGILEKESLACLILG